MEQNPRQQKLAFAVIVVMLAGLGIYLLLPKAAAPRSTPRAAPSTTPPAASPSPQPVVTPVPSPAAGPADIFRWLPFTQADLGRAVAVATQASAYYETYRFDESATTYGDRMSNLVTSDYLKVLEEDYSTFGVARQRSQSRQVSRADAVIDSLRAFDSSSITFVVTITQHIQEVGGTTSPSGQFAVTVVRSGGTWQVDQIQPASAGNN